MDIQAWWNSLDALLRVLFSIAIPATTVLAIQLVLIAIGLGHAGMPDGGGADAGHLGGLHHFDFHFDGAHHDLTGAGAASHDLTGAGAASHDPGHIHPDGSHPGDAGFSELHLFTLSGIVSFFTVFGWSSIILYQNGLPGAVSVLVALALGFGAMLGAAKLVQWSVRLQEDGNLVLENAVGMIAEVYVSIPAAGGGEGKVTLTLQGQFLVLDAATEGREVIPSGIKVRVTGLKEDTLVVERV